MCCQTQSSATQAKSRQLGLRGPVQQDGLYEESHRFEGILKFAGRQV